MDWRNRCSGGRGTQLLHRLIVLALSSEKVNEPVSLVRAATHRHANNECCQTGKTLEDQKAREGNIVTLNSVNSNKADQTL